MIEVAQISTLAEARSRVTEELHLRTRREGLEGARRFVVLVDWPSLESMPIDDLTVLVSKADGSVTREVHFDVEPEVSMMREVRDET